MTTISYEEAQSDPMMDPRERVKRGVAWLDANAPANWHELVKLPQFDLSDSCRCVLAFVFVEKAEEDGEPNGFMWATTRLTCSTEILSDEEEMLDWPAYCGFDYMSFENKDHFRLLQDEWISVIRDRRAA